MVSTVIATLASQTSFTLDVGSADDDDYNNCTAIVSDLASGIQKCSGFISDYTGSSKTVTLAADPGIFTMAAGDNITIIAASALSNMAAISSDATAADNLELQYDTTGLSGDTFPATQSQVGNLTSGTAAINTTSESFTKAGAEPETNAYTDTHTLNGTYHIVEDDTTATDAYYQFDVGGNGVPVSITWDGYAQSNGDSYSVWAYNYGGTAYEQVGTLSGTNGTTLITETFNLTVSHVGVGANIGKVRFRFLSADGTAFATDRILCSYAVVAQSVGYANGAVWVDTAHGTAGTESYVNGVADNPVDTIADANTISGNLSLHKFQISSDSSVTFAASQANDSFIGQGYALALGGQAIAGVNIIGATVSGTGTVSGDEAHFAHCEIGTTTLGASHLAYCGLTSTLTLSDAATYTLQTCHSEIAGSATPIIDFGAIIGNTSLNMRRYSGGIEVENMGGAGTDTMSLEGDGQLIVNANCTGGSIVYRGHFTITDNSGGAVTITSDEVVTNVAAILVDTADMQPKLGSPAGASISADIAVIESQTDDIGVAGAGLTDLGGMSTTMKAQVNTEVDDVLFVDARTELSSIPTTTSPIGEQMQFNFQYFRNKRTVTATTETMLKEDASTSLGTATVSDDGTTFTKGEMN